MLIKKILFDRKKYAVIYKTFIFQLVFAVDERNNFSRIFCSLYNCFLYENNSILND